MFAFISYPFFHCSSCVVENCLHVISEWINCIDVSHSSSKFCILSRKIASLFFSSFWIIPATATDFPIILYSGCTSNSIGISWRRSMSKIDQSSSFSDRFDLLCIHLHLRQIAQILPYHFFRFTPLSEIKPFITSFIVARQSFEIRFSRKGLHLQSNLMKDSIGNKVFLRAI